MLRYDKRDIPGTSIGTVQRTSLERQDPIAPRCVLRLDEVVAEIGLVGTTTTAHDKHLERVTRILGGTTWTARGALNHLRRL